MNTDLTKKSKSYLQKYFFKLLNGAVYGKTMDDIRKHRDTKLVITKIIRNYRLSQSNYQTKKFFQENLLAKEMKKQR